MKAQIRSRRSTFMNLNWQSGDLKCDFSEATSSCLNTLLQKAYSQLHVHEWPRTGLNWPFIPAPCACWGLSQWESLPACLDRSPMLTSAWWSSISCLSSAPPVNSCRSSQEVKSHGCKKINYHHVKCWKTTTLSASTWFMCALIHRSGCQR